MSDEDSSNTAALIVLSILITIIMQGALEAFFTYLIDGRSLFVFLQAWPPSNDTILRIFQFLLFLLLLLRFYGGAYRFNDEHVSEKIIRPTLDLVVNLGGTFLLFTFFYLTGIHVWDSQFFFALIFVFHLIDVLWFFAAWFMLPVNSRLKSIIGYFFLWDALTVGGYLVLSYCYWESFTNGGNNLQIGLLILLFAVSALDLWVLKPFYVSPQKWRAELDSKVTS